MTCRGPPPVQAQTNPNRGKVMVLSLGTDSNVQVLNDAINNAVNKGFVVVAAAGNDGADACGSSPASARLAIAVGATYVIG